jgi:uncharacterized membrane protein (DUF4010 family)
MDIIIRLIEAAALGALIGLEREVVSNRIISDFKNPQVIFGGLRSYTLMSLLGAVAVFLGDVIGDITIMLIFTGTILFLFILFSYIYSAFKQHQFGVTSEFAAVTVYLLGALVMLGEVQIAIFLGIFVALMLNYKARIAPLIDKIGEEEISTTLKFAVISLIILPLLPDHKYALHDMLVFLPEGPLTTAPFFNPYGIWFFVVIMSAVSYVGYVLTKALGAGRGIILSGALGGLVSSTAVTSAMAEKSKQEEKAFLYPTVIATIAACSIMLFRVIGIVMLFNPILLETLLYPIIAMIATSAVLLWWAWGKSKVHETGVQVAELHESPFQIGPALKFAGFVILIKFASTLALVYQSSFQALTGIITGYLPILSGILEHLPIYLVSLFSGLADVDAITQEMAELSNGTGVQSLTTLAATTAIIIALVTNTAVKIGLARKFGSKLFGMYVFRMLGAVLVVGVGVLGLIALWN